MVGEDGQSGAERTTSRQRRGGAARRVEQAMVKVPPGPRVGAAMGGRERVGAVLGGMGGGAIVVVCVGRVRLAFGM